jgi:hypothetical protein
VKDAAGHKRGVARPRRIVTARPVSSYWISCLRRASSPSMGGLQHHLAAGQFIRWSPPVRTSARTSWVSVYRRVTTAGGYVHRFQTQDWMRSYQCRAFRAVLLT